jgi:type VI secretion system protein ImpG
MFEDLLPYYERELSSLRGLAGEFAEHYPKVARRLQIDRDHCEDPHVERLLEGFAFLAARIHRKLDDDYPEIAESFMQVLYPHFLRPMPSATIVQLVPDPKDQGTAERYTVPRHTPVCSPRIQGVSCTFRTTAETDLWPLRVARARIELTQASEYLRRLTSADAVLTLDLETLESRPIPALSLDRLRFYLDGPPPLMALLYELLGFRLQEARAGDGLEPPRASVVLPTGSVRLAGFGPDEDLFESDVRSFPGFRLLAEYFAFPEKFMFFEVAGLDAKALQDCGPRLRLQFMFSPYGATERHLRLIQTLSAGNFKLGCAAIVNLFQQSGNPIQVSHFQLGYPVTASNQHPGACEIYAIDRVARSTSGAAPAEATEEVPPFYSIRHGSEDRSTRFYWYATRERSRGRNNQGTDVELALVDLEFQPVRPANEILSLQLTCTNRNLPEAIPFSVGGTIVDPFTVPQHPAVKLARPLRKPSPSLAPPSKRGLQWRLISHLSLNHLAMASQGPQALQETLELYNFSDSAAVARQIQGIVGLTTRPATTRLPGKAFASFVRGVEVHITFDESCFVGSNLFLFASVLERFLAHSCPPNSFVLMRMSTLQQEGEVAQWPPRAGETALM